MTKTKMILIFAFLVVFAAGGSLGAFLMAWQRPPHRPSLAEELNLSAAQREQMDKIWAQGMEATFRQHGEQRAALAQKRDQDIAAILTQDQHANFDAIQAAYQHGVEQLSQERKKAFEEAVEKTKKILTPAQAAKYEEVLKNRREHGEHGGGPGGGGPGFRGQRRSHSAPASSPATNEQPASRSGGQP